MRMRRRRSSLAICRMDASRESENQLNGVGEALPRRGLARELLPPRGRELVELRAPAELGDTPLGAHEPVVLETVERGVQRPLIHAERVAGNLLDAARHGPAVHGLAAEVPEDQQSERSLEEFVSGEGHRLLLAVDTKMLLALVSTVNNNKLSAISYQLSAISKAKPP